MNIIKQQKAGLKRLTGYMTRKQNNYWISNYCFGGEEPGRLLKIKIKHLCILNGEKAKI